MKLKIEPLYAFKDEVKVGASLGIDPELLENILSWPGCQLES
jgi:hypothetical protein